MDTRKAGRKGGLQRKKNHDKTRYELAVELSGLVTHHDELVEILKERPVPWLRAKIAELRQHGTKR